MNPLKTLFANHPRRWRENRYVYPVIARRSAGLSIGVNLNPDGACNFDCIYCSVDRRALPRAAAVDLRVLETELRHMVAIRDRLFDEPEFRDVPPRLRRLNDIAFSGDGEPTAVPAFPPAARVVAAIRDEFALRDVKTVLITDACFLARPAVAETLALLDQHNLEIWAKLDAGTDAYFRQVNRSSVALGHVLESIRATAQMRPIVIQSLFMRIRGVPPPQAEIEAYVERLGGLRDGGARISLVQVYTVARRTAEEFVAPLTAEELESIAAAVRPLGIPVAVFH